VLSVATGGEEDSTFVHGICLSIGVHSAAAQDEDESAAEAGQDSQEIDMGDSKKLGYRENAHGGEELEEERVPRLVEALAPAGKVVGRGAATSALDLSSHTAV